MVIGTKAQYIKTAPLLRLMYRRGIDFRLIDTGQHAALAPRLREELGVKEPDCQLGPSRNVKSLPDALAWTAGLLGSLILRPSELTERVFQPGPGYCVIHGDTVSTLLALLLAKRAGKTVVHLEAGLRSFSLLRPFPEELIRIVCMRWADLLIAPSEWAMRNLRNLGVRGRCVLLTQNTNVEAVHHALRHADRRLVPVAPYALMTIHRVETIFSRKRLEFVIDVAREISLSRSVVFVLHDATATRLRKFDLLEELQNIRGLRLLPLLRHSQFLPLLESADFIITDGGSVQEESFYLDVPCLVMRTETERTEGVDSNVRLCHFRMDIVQSFIDNHAGMRRNFRTQDEHPSESVLQAILESGLDRESRRTPAMRDNSRAP